MPLPLLLLLLLLCAGQWPQPASAQYEDSRCKCVCPQDAKGNGTKRRVWITTVPFGQCACEKVVEPLPPRPAEYCLRCECKSETRSTSIQKVVVVLVLCVLGGLCMYMLFLSILQPLLAKAGLQQRLPMLHTKLEEEEPTQEEASASAGASGRQRTQSGQVSEVVSRARDKQEKWTRTVEAQRHRVYNQHSLLN